MRGCVVAVFQRADAASAQQRADEAAKEAARCRSLAEHEAEVWICACLTSRNRLQKRAFD